MEGKQQSKKKSYTPLLKAVKNINKLIKDGDINVKASKPASTSSDKLEQSKPVLKTAAVAKPKLSVKTKTNEKSQKPPRVFSDRGVVYLAHIPHGFFEEEMKAFFSQFGHVTRVRLVRSHKTGNSRGFAFVEFRFTEVAQVVADTMNNYLMRNRLLKATYIPPEKQNAKMFLHSKNYGPETCIGVVNQRKAVKSQNKSLSENESNLRIDRHKQHLIKVQEKLRAQGVDCLFQVDGGTSKRLLEGSENSLPSSKRARISSPAPKISSLKATKPPSMTSVSTKKTSSTVKGQTSLKNIKSVKSEKGGDKSAKKLDVKSDKKKVVEKKSVAVKVVKKVNVAKSGSVKKDVIKKNLKKKPALKKK